MPRNFQRVSPGITYLSEVTPGAARCTIIYRGAFLQEMAAADRDDSDGEISETPEDECCLPDVSSDPRLGRVQLALRNYKSEGLRSHSDVKQELANNLLAAVRDYVSPPNQNTKCFGCDPKIVAEVGYADADGIALICFEKFSSWATWLVGKPFGKKETRHLFRRYSDYCDSAKAQLSPLLAQARVTVKAFGNVLRNKCQVLRESLSPRGLFRGRGAARD
jgi:hypothetical protein